jgi:hypothetical protein
MVGACCGCQLLDECERVARMAQHQQQQFRQIPQARLARYEQMDMIVQRHRIKLQACPRQGHSRGARTPLPAAER